MNTKRIDISNYEAWMLDSIEGRLSNEEELQLQEFFVAHPELNEDMELLSELELSPMDVVHPNKDSLKMPDEQELLLISALESGSDGLEFSGDELKEFQRYQSTILKADTGVVFPDKESLKKEQHTPIIPMWVKRLAIAASLIGVVLTLFFQQQQPESYEPRLSATELPTFDSDFPEASNSSNYAESQGNPVPEEHQSQEHEPTKQLAQEESSPLLDPGSDSDLHDSDMGIELAQEPEIELQNDLIEVEAPETEFAEQPAQEGELNPTPEDPFVAEVPAIELPEQVVPENQSLASLPDEEVQQNEKVTESTTREIGSVLDLLKHASRQSDILAIQDVKKETAYVETSLKVGRYKVALKRRKKN